MPPTHPRQPCALCHHVAEVHLMFGRKVKGTNCMAKKCECTGYKKWKKEKKNAENA